MNVAAGQRIDIAFPQWFTPYWQPARYKIAHGGRGSGKSWQFARALIVLSLQKKIRILCARELQNSIQESVHHLIADQIDVMGLAAMFSVREKSIQSVTGAEFLFKGVRGMKNNAAQLKSLEGVDICWIEEGQTISRASLETLTPTIRKPGSEIWITFNPDQEDDPVYRLAMNPPPGSIVRQVNWYDNPWFPPDLDQERRWLQQTDPNAYAHVWEGRCRQYTDAQVLHGKWRIGSFTPEPDWHGPYFGADWGFARDPTVLVKVWIADNQLYVEQEAWGIGVEIDRLPALFDKLAGARNHVIRADNSRPETISYLKRQGFRIQGAAKWTGSIEDGIGFLRGFDVITIHPRCRHAAEEARLYSYKVDALTGDILPRIEDRHNHVWDAVRYALEPLIRKRQGHEGVSLAWL